MAEDQIQHRHQLENIAVEEDIKGFKRGQTFGFTIAIVGLTSALILVLNDKETTAGIIGGATLVGLVTVFLSGMNKN